MVWAPVYADDGMNGVVFLLVGVDVEGDRGCLWDVEVLVCDVHVALVIYRDIRFMHAGVAFDGIAVRIGVFC